MNECGNSVAALARRQPSYITFTSDHRSMQPGSARSLRSLSPPRTSSSGTWNVSASYERPRAHSGAGSISSMSTWRCSLTRMYPLLSTALIVLVFLGHGTVALIMLEWQPEREGGAPPHLALHGDHGVQRMGDAPSDGESDSHPRRVVGGLEAPEFLEEMLLLVRGDARTGVGYIQGNPAPWTRCFATLPRNRVPHLLSTKLIVAISKMSWRLTSRIGGSAIGSLAGWSRYLTITDRPGPGATDCITIRSPRKYPFDPTYPLVVRIAATR